MKNFTEFTAELDEAVSVEHDRYVRSHGKKASGSGTWMFTHKRAGAVDYKNEKHVHQATGSFSDAKKSAKEWGKTHGHSTVYVMEEVELDEAKTSVAVRMQRAIEAQRAKSDASRARTPSSIPKKEEPKKTVAEGAEADKHYDESEQHKNKASKALETSDMEGYHHHMSNHHEAKSRWHEAQGRYSSADREAAKAEEHHEKGLRAAGVPSRSLKSEEVESTVAENYETFKKSVTDSRAENNKRFRELVALRAKKDAAKKEEPKKQGVAEGSEWKSRHSHKQEQDKKYDEYRRNQEAANKKPLRRGDWAATQRKGQQGVKEGNDPTSDSAQDARGSHRGEVKKNKDGSYVATNMSGSRGIFKSEKEANAHANSGKQGVKEDHELMSFAEFTAESQDK